MAAASGPTADLAAVLEESVAAHMVADVPVASFLSGGLDSSLITALAADREPSAARERCSARTSGETACFSALVNMGLTWTRPHPTQVTTCISWVGEGRCATGAVCSDWQIGQALRTATVPLLAERARWSAPTLG